MDGMPRTGLNSRILITDRMERKVISEAEFIAYEDRELATIAKEIRESGVSLYDIAKECRLNWETVKAAASAVPVKFSTQCRIKCYLDYLRKKKTDVI